MPRRFATPRRPQHLTKWGSCDIFSQYCPGDSGALLTDEMSCFYPTLTKIQWIFSGTQDFVEGWHCHLDDQRKKSDVRTPSISPRLKESLNSCFSFTELELPQRKWQSYEADMWMRQHLHHLDDASRWIWRLQASRRWFWILRMYFSHSFVQMVLFCSVHIPHILDSFKIWSLITGSFGSLAGCDCIVISGYGIVQPSWRESRQLITRKKRQQSNTIR